MFLKQSCYFCSGKLQNSIHELLFFPHYTRHACYSLEGLSFLWPFRNTLFEVKERGCIFTICFASCVFLLTLIYILPLAMASRKGTFHDDNKNKMPDEIAIEFFYIYKDNNYKFDINCSPLVGFYLSLPIGSKSSLQFLLH